MKIWQHSACDLKINNLKFDKSFVTSPGLQQILDNNTDYHKFSATTPTPGFAHTI